MGIDEILGLDERSQNIGFWRDLAGVAWEGFKIFLVALAILWGIPLLAVAAFIFLR